MREETKKFIKYGIIVLILCLGLKYFEQVISVMKMILGAMTPLILGVVLAYILNILVKKMEKFYFPKSKNKLIQVSKRPASIVFSIFFVGAIFLFVLNLVIPELVSSLTLIGKEIPTLLSRLQAFLVDELNAVPQLQESIESMEIDWQVMIQKVINYVVAGAGGVLTSVVSFAQSFFGFITQFVIGLIFAIYVLFNKEKLFSQLERLAKAYLSSKTYEKLIHVIEVSHNTFSNFIVGQCVEAVILGSLCTVGMLVFRFPYAGMTGAVIGVTALVPIVGAYIGAVVGAFMIFTVNPLQAVFFLVFLIILQQLEGNIIYPKVVGGSIGLPGMWVLAAVTVGGSAMGISGMILGVPITATAYKLLKETVSNKEIQKGNNKEIEQQKNKKKK